MSPADLLQAILLKCEQETASDFDRGSQDFAGLIVDMIETSKRDTKVLPRSDLAPGTGLARLQFSRPLVFLDLETTSRIRDEARIIEVAATKIHPDGHREGFQSLVYPGFKVDREIEELTTIKNTDLELAPRFEQLAPALLEFLEDCYLVGYNLRNYDGPILWEEFHTAGANWPVRQDDFLDPMEIFFKMEPRSLEGACYFYLGHDHSKAHRAQPDVDAVIEVLDAQLAKYRGLPDEVDVLIQETKKDRRIDMAGYFAMNEEGVPCFNFGKHGPQDGRPGLPCHRQRGYLRWMLEPKQNFPAHTKQIASYMLDELKGKPEDDGCAPYT